MSVGQIDVRRFKVIFDAKQARRIHEESGKEAIACERDNWSYVAAFEARPAGIRTGQGQNKLEM